MFPTASLSARLVGTALLAASVSACSTPMLRPRADAPPAPPAAVAENPPPSPPTPEPPSAPAPAAPAAAADGGAPAGWLHETAREAWSRLGGDCKLMCDDYRNYYSWGVMAELAVGVAAAAPIANTSADQDIRRWYQRRVRGETTDEYAQFFNYAGQFWLALPVCMEGAALMGKADEDYASDGGLYEWSNRSLRAILVGVPPMLSMYVVLGSSRPDRDDSHWHPFNDIHGVSGHTFMGAVPFLTAAAMADEDWMKVPLFLGSFATGWARLDLDRHYFSQVMLGWWMAYVSVQSVGRTQAEQRALTITPTFLDGPGVAAVLRY